MTIERQEIHCHNCNQYIQFDMDMSMNGNQVLRCPACGHEHCRVVVDGKITSDRWDQRNGDSIYIGTASVTSSIASTFSTYRTATATTVTDNFLYDSWMNTTSTS